MDSSKSGDVLDLRLQVSWKPGNGLFFETLSRILMIRGNVFYCVAKDPPRPGTKIFWSKNTWVLRKEDGRKTELGKPQMCEGPIGRNPGVGAENRYKHLPSFKRKTSGHIDKLVRFSHSIRIRFFQLFRAVGGVGGGVRK